MVAKEGEGVRGASEGGLGPGVAAGALLVSPTASRCHRGVLVDLPFRPSSQNLSSAHVQSSPLVPS